MNDVNKEKKSFERLLDDCVAQGMDRGIQVLLSQVEFILVNEQKREDYNPPRDAMPDLKPTKVSQLLVIIAFTIMIDLTRRPVKIRSSV
jgi:recyclin-1